VKSDAVPALQFLKSLRPGTTGQEADKMEMRNVRTFLRLSELLNFTETAEELGYSQGAVTVQIRQLEQELGTKLFDRIGRTTSLTENGIAFIPYARAFIKAGDEARDFLKKEAPPSGKLRLAAYTSLVDTFLPPVLMHMHSRYPLIETQLHTVDEIDTAVNELTHNYIDMLYFIDAKLTLRNWIKVFERPEKIVFVTSVMDPIAQVKSPSLEEVLTRPLALSTKGETYTKYLETAISESGLEMRPFLRSSSVNLLVRFMLANTGVSYLPLYLVKDYVENGELAIIEPRDFTELTMWRQLVYRKDKWLSPEMKVFIELATDE
jgi:DNA-binding transcriptional LysR family regulator